MSGTSYAEGVESTTHNLCLEQGRHSVRFAKPGEYVCCFTFSLQSVQRIRPFEVELVGTRLGHI